MTEEKLKSYRQKRDFEHTPEPPPVEAKGTGRQPIFVIQKHKASHLHYDFRLEIDGVLKSWAVPKGPSTDPKTKRLAVLTEDHPLDYALFEGVIPQGQYGAGTVLVWDAGNYRPLGHKDGEEITPGEAFERGHVAFWLEGKKLRGAYALTRTAMGWLLVKKNDEYADSTRDVLSEQPESALSGRTIEEIR